MKKKEIDIVHIYAGTSGTAGLYLHEIYEALKKDFRQELFVSYYYPFKEGKKVYFKYSDLASTQKIKFKGIFRLIIRYFELVWGLIRIFFLLVFKFKNVKIINYSLFTNQKIELYFLKILKNVFNIKIAITLHDIKPFATYRKINTEINKKQLFIDFADFLIVHNNNSIIDLKELYRINEKKIIKYPFPVMNLKLLKNSTKVSLGLPKNQKPIFSFVGNIRKSKGYDILIESFSGFLKQGGVANLIIAGNIPYNSRIDFNFLKKNSNVIIIDRFLKDEEYIDIIEKSDYIVLPYRYGTNTGIVSSAYSVLTNVIVSDIPMFDSFSYINRKLMFKSENIKSLESLIFNLYSSKIHGYNNEQLKNKLLKYQDVFKIEIIESYKKMIL